MYLVKNISTATVRFPKKLGEADQDWAPGQIDQVNDDVIDRYRPHTSVFSIQAKNGAITTGVAAVTGLTATDVCVDGVVHQTTFTFAAMAIAVTDALAYASQKLFDFPEGRINILGSTGTIQWAVTTTRASTINDSASLTWAVGSAAASNIALTSTMVDEMALATKVLSAATTALNTASTSKLAASAQFDGTGTALSAYLNTAFATNTDIDGDGTLTATGSITITWANLGDY
jgi:hypothetical protein